jgi:succinoglycan biosynthesis protein ExoM
MSGANPSTLEVPERAMDAATATLTYEISVCICTLRRGELLLRLLRSLENQRTDGLFKYSVVVADNDGGQSARTPVTAFVASTRLAVSYCLEPQQNIALARNKAIENAAGDFIAFIDDDEFPAEDWLLNLFKTWQASGADGVLGPVKPHFESEPPRWVTKGGFFDRPTHPTGFKVGWEEARTGNVLFRKSILNAGEAPFRSQFNTAGEDVDFFRRMMEKGCTFVWCNEAVAYETVPASRCNRAYLLRRALLRGSNFPKHPAKRFENIVKSLLAVPCYTLALPVLALFGQHVFLQYLIKLLDHASRLLAFLGISLVTERHT